MPRYKLTVEYDGTPYCGWQRQVQLPTVQQAVEHAIKQFCGEVVSITAAGRTDTGVHALGQIAHVDLAKCWRPDTVCNALNAYLLQNHDTISILSTVEVDESFDARFSARKRHYVYKIINRRAPSVLKAKRMWWVPKGLDVDAMQEAARRLIGYHDFTTFRSSQCQAKSPVRHLDQLDVLRLDDQRIEVHASAPSFLHNQVRSLVGSLAQVGLGRRTADWIEEALHARDRRRCGPLAPPHGLYLAKVDY